MSRLKLVEKKKKVVEKPKTYQVGDPTHLVGQGIQNHWLYKLTKSKD